MKLANFNLFTLLYKLLKVFSENTKPIVLNIKSAYFGLQNRHFYILFDFPLSAKAV